MSNDTRFSNERREALKSLGIVAVASLFPTALRADAPPGSAVDEASDQAKALGYRNNTADVDSGVYARHEVTQKCLNCQLYQSQESWGPCALFPGKQVNAQGWCSAWVKRVG